MSNLEGKGDDSLQGPALALHGKPLLPLTGRLQCAFGVVHAGNDRPLR